MIKHRKANLIVSEPWEFVTQHGVGPFPVEILRTALDEDEPALLLRMSTTLEHNGVFCEYLIGRPRHGDMAGLLGGESVGFSFTVIPRERAESKDPFDLSWWRGGVGLMGEIALS